MGPDAGWYDDPQTAGQHRWWDGQAWTHATRPAAGAPVADPTRPIEAVDATTRAIDPVRPPAPVDGPPASNDGTPAPEPAVSSGRSGVRIALLVVLVALVSVGATLGVIALTSGDPVAPLLADERDVDATDGEDGTEVDGTDAAADDAGSDGTAVETSPEPAAEPTPTPTPTPPPSPRPSPTAPALPAPTASDVRFAFEGYLWALDDGAIDLAYEYVSPSLRSRSGWDRPTFSRFWTEQVVGARLVEVTDVRTASGVGVIEATVDYALPDGGTSREDVRATMVPGFDGELQLDRYEVLRSRVLP